MQKTHSKKRYNIQYKLLALAEGDADFRALLTRLFHLNFQQLKESIQDIMMKRELKELACINHKYRTTFLMFDFWELAAEIQKGKSLLEAKNPDTAQLKQIAHKVEYYCTDILNELSEVT